MRLLPFLASLFFPACASPGAQGLPVPPPLVPLAIVRPGTSNSALAAPAGFRPRPDIATPLYHLSATRLYAEVEAVAAARPRTYPQASYPAELQADYVVRSRLFNFPDLVLAAVKPRGPENAALILYSRSVYGSGDFGVNRARVKAWLAALARRLANPVTR